MASFPHQFATTAFAAGDGKQRNMVGVGRLARRGDKPGTLPGWRQFTFRESHRAMDSRGPNGKDQGQRPVPANGHEEAPDVFLPGYRFPTPEAKHQHQRARAEERFRMDFGLWETANRENPPHTVSLSVSAAGEVGTARRNDLDIVLSLENYFKQFLFAALYAYGDLLLDKRTPPTEAVREFEQHADELPKKTFNRKWLFGLRCLELLETEFAERFWLMQREVVEEARYDFEEDVWSTDDEPAEESGPAQIREVEPAACPEPASPEHTPKVPPRKRGPKPDHEAALLVATIVARVAPDRDIPFGKTENARRTIPITQRTATILETRRAVVEGEWAFPAPTRSGRIEKSSLKKQHPKACTLAKVAEFPLYTFRHTCLTRWAAHMDPYTWATSPATATSPRRAATSTRKCRRSRKPSNARATAMPARSPRPPRHTPRSTWSGVGTKLGTIAKRRLGIKFSNRRIYLNCKRISGRGEWIRTTDLLVPNQAL